MAVSAKQSQASDKSVIDHEEADVEGLTLGSARSMEKQTENKGKCDFENLLREIDAKISGKADMGCNVVNADSVRIMENVMVSAQHEEAIGGGGGFNAGPWV